MTGDITLFDNITIEYTNDNIEIYNVVYNKNGYLHLHSEDKDIVESLHIEDSKLITYYKSGLYSKSTHEIQRINVFEEGLKRKCPGQFIEGNLLTYNKEMAEKYFLEEDFAISETKFKRRIKEEQ